MLFQVEKVPNSGLYWLNEVLQNFYQRLIASEEFNDCCEVGFQPVLDASAKTNELFQGVFDQYAALAPELKSEFTPLYNNLVNLVEHFDDNTLPILESSNGISDIWTACKKLGGYLYTTTMGLGCFTCENVANTSMLDHFEEFRNLNGRVCCFCGLEDYMAERTISSEFGNEGENQWRASYDHYLAKKHYPFLSVDFDNLLPCCDTCNSKAKGEIDLLKREGNRYLTFHPFNDPAPASLNIDYTPDNTFDDKWRVSIALGDANLSEKMSNWDNTFQVTSRASKRLNDHFETSYLTDLLTELPDIESVKRALRSAIVRARDVMKNNRESYFKALCFEKLLDQPNNVLESLHFAANQQHEGRSLD